MSWGDVSYVTASKTRKAILIKLETSPRTPTFLAKALSINLANVSRALSELDDKKLVICLTPDQKVGKIYTLTKKGKEVLSQMEKMEK